MTDITKTTSTRVAILLVTLCFGLSLVQQPQLSSGWHWDVGNGLGFLAFAGLLLLFLNVGNGSRQRLHQWIGYGVLGSLLAHITWLWAADITIWHYLSSNAPAYMLAGWAALCLILAITILALPVTRRFWHGQFSNFQRWHRWLAWLSLLLVLWHMLGSGYYLSLLEAWLYGVLASCVWLANRRGLYLATSTSATVLWWGPLCMGLFVLIKQLP